MLQLPSKQTLPICFFALNLRTNQLLLFHTVNAALFYTKYSSTMSASRSSPKTPPAPTTGRITFQSTPKSGLNSTRLSNEEPASPKLKFSKEKVFENNLTQLFTKRFLAILTSKDAVLNEVRDCILQGDEQRWKGVNPYLNPTREICMFAPDVSALMKSGHPKFASRRSD